jgi:hypothetical protein
VQQNYEEHVKKLKVDKARAAKLAHSEARSTISYAGVVGYDAALSRLREQVREIVEAEIQREELDKQRALGQQPTSMGSLVSAAAGALTSLFRGSTSASTAAPSGSDPVAGASALVDEAELDEDELDILSSNRSIKVLGAGKAVAAQAAAQAAAKAAAEAAATEAAHAESERSRAAEAAHQAAEAAAAEAAASLALAAATAAAAASAAASTASAPAAPSGLPLPSFGGPGNLWGGKVARWSLRRMLAHFAELGFRTALEQRGRVAVGVYSPNVPCDDPVSQHAVPRAGDTAAQFAKSARAAAVPDGTGEPVPLPGAAVYDDVVALLSARTAPSIPVGAPAASELDARMRNGEAAAAGSSVTWASPDDIEFPPSWVPPAASAAAAYEPPVVFTSPAVHASGMAAAMTQHESRVLGLTLCLVERPADGSAGTPTYRRVASVGVHAASNRLLA